MANITNNLDRAIADRITKGPKQSLKDSFDKTNLDTQNPEPEGGPINDPVVVVDGMVAGSGFSQTYSKENPYLQDSITNQNSILYENGITPEDSTSPALKITALDVESSEAGVKQGVTGGPNRIAPNKLNTVGQDGTYQLKQYPSTKNNFTPNPTSGTPLKNKEGENVPNQEVQAYTPQNTYMDYMVEQKSKNDNI